MNNRQIKFRAWNELPDRSGEMVTEENSGLTSAQILDRFSKVMQFTGLKDRNGVEIYEGDVLKTEHYRDPHKTMHYLLHVIKWDKDYGTWVAVNTNSESDSITEPGNCQLWVMMSRQEVEVDTNIHQHPHLITK